MTIYSAFILLIITSAAASGTGVYSGCCLRALEDGAYLNKSTPLRDYTCGQAFNKSIPAAPEVAVPYSWCRANCAGWTLATASDLSNWANTLTQIKSSRQLVRLPVQQEQRLLQVLMLLSRCDPTGLFLLPLHPHNTDHRSCNLGNDCIRVGWAYAIQRTARGMLGLYDHLLP
jgi:hypothetical protein